MNRYADIAIKLGAATLILFAAACTNVPGTSNGSGKTVKQKIGRPYQIGGIWYYPKAEQEYDQVGIASWYGERFHGAPTANGEIFDMNEISAAHTTLPLPSWVEVTNLENDKKLIVRINDRGPFVDGRLIDLSKATARELGYLKKGVARVRVRLVDPPEGVAIANAPSQPHTQPQPVQVASLEPVTLPADQPTAPADQPTAPADQPTAEPPAVIPAPAPALAPAVTTTPEDIALPVRKPPALAQQELASLIGDVQQPQIKPVIPDEPQNASSSSDFVEESGRYMVQVATFASEENAARLAASFDDTYSAYLSPYSLDDGRVLNRVRLGPFQTKSEAIAALNAAAKKGLKDARIFLQSS